MWQDVLVTLVAAGAVAVLGRRWLRARTAAPGACESCASSPDRAKRVIARPQAEEEVGRERVGPGGNYRF